MSELRSPVQVLQREIQQHEGSTEKVGGSYLITKYLAALELAKADAELEAHRNVKPGAYAYDDVVNIRWRAIQAELVELARRARTKLYEALQR